MARDREAAQDIALYHMEKLTRRNKDEAKKERSLKEQIDESPTERRKNLPKVEWYKDVRDIVMLDKKCRVSNNLWNWVTVKYKEDIEKLRTSGAPYQEALTFAKDKETEFINR